MLTTKLSMRQGRNPGSVEEQMQDCNLSQNTPKICDKNSHPLCVSNWKTHKGNLV